MTTLTLARRLSVSGWTVWHTVARDPIMFGAVQRTPTGRYRIGRAHAVAVAVVLGRDPRLVDGMTG